MEAQLAADPAPSAELTATVSPKFYTNTGTPQHITAPLWKPVTRLNGRNRVAQMMEQRSKRANFNINALLNSPHSPILPVAELRAMAQTDAFKALNTPFSDYGTCDKQKVGEVVEHREHHFGTATYEEWVNLYFTEVIHWESFKQLALTTVYRLRNDYLPKLKARQTDRTLSEKMRADARRDYPALRAKLSDPRESVRFILNAIFYRVLVQTNDGVETEHISDVLSPAPIRRATKDEDFNYHLDRVGEEVAYQIKPNKFRYATRVEGLRQAQIKHIVAHLKYQEETGKAVSFLFHDDLHAGVWNPVPLADFARGCNLYHLIEQHEAQKVRELVPA